MNQQNCQIDNSWIEKDGAYFFCLNCDRSWRVTEEKEERNHKWFAKSEPKVESSFEFAPLPTAKKTDAEGEEATRKAIEDYAGADRLYTN